MNEAQQIEEAFATKIREVYSVFHSSYTMAHSNAAQETQAEKAFTIGILHARHIRERSLAILHNM